MIRKALFMRFYFDESGSITTSQEPFNRFFIVAGCYTTDSKKVKRVFRKAKVNYLKHNPELKLDVKKEIKGSQMPLEFKTYIFDELIKKTDIQFNFLVFDNHHATPNLRLKPSITFNYLMYLQTDKLISGYCPVYLDLDDRNKAVESLKALEEYLQTKFCVEVDRLPHISVEFFDSADHTMIQIADILANHLHRLFKQVAFDKEYKDNAQLLANLHQSNIQYGQYFPASKCQCLHLFKS